MHLWGYVCPSNSHDHLSLGQGIVDVVSWLRGVLGVDVGREVGSVRREARLDEDLEDTRDRAG